MGMHLSFAAGAGGVRAQTVIDARFQGWRGMAHGGIAMALLDEAMAHAAGFAGYRGLTARVTARFRHPIPIGAQITIEGRVAWIRRRSLGLEARVLDALGTVLVEGEGTFVARGRLEDVHDRRNPAVRAAGRQ